MLEPEEGTSSMLYCVEGELPSGLNCSAIVEVVAEFTETSGLCTPVTRFAFAPKPVSVATLLIVFFIFITNVLVLFGERLLTVYPVVPPQSSYEAHAIVAPRSPFPVLLPLVFCTY